MLIVGAGGFAKEVLEILFRQGKMAIHFYDDQHQHADGKMFGRFPVLQSVPSAATFFRDVYPGFTLGIGGTAIRKALYDRLTACGGQVESVIAATADIGSFGNEIMEGVNIMSGAIVTNCVKIGRGTLINFQTTVCHDTEVSDFCELAPGVRISGHCRIGESCMIGTNATVLPGISIAANTVIGASALVTRNITEAGTYVGIPAKRIR